MFRVIPQFLTLLPLLIVVQSLEQILDSTMTIQWSITGDELDLNFICQISLGYCALGLSGSMSNCDMIAAISDGVTVTLQDYYSYNHDIPSTDQQLGGTDDVVFVSGGLDSNGNINVSFRRKLSTGDNYDQIIEPDVKQSICWAYRDHQKGWQEHDSFSSGIFVFASSALTEYFALTGSEEYLHGIQLSVAWCLLAPIGILSARYFKHTGWWIYAHIISLLIASVLTILSITEIFGVDALALADLSQDILEHSRLGMIITSLVIGQVVFGMFTSYFKILTKNTGAASVAVKIHRIAGFGMLIAGLINCTKGWQLYSDAMSLAAYVIALIAVCAIFLFFEVRQVFFKNRESGEMTWLKEMGHMEAAERIDGGEELMYADDLVINVKHFKLSHPGGAYLIQESIGEDTGKYMVGCSSYGGNYNPYTHSAKAFAYLRRLAIARIPYPNGYLRPADGYNNRRMEFVMVQKREIGLNTYLMYLKSEFFQMASYCAKPSWLGKHYKVTQNTSTGTVNRYYSSLFVDPNEWSNELGITHEKEKPMEEGLVKFIFKVYPGGAMTTFLNKLQRGEVIQMQGPLGPGLMLDQIKGNCIALAGGTGLVPFLDLVYYAWKNINQDVQAFNLTLFVSFRTLEDGFALEILETMKNIEGNWLNLIIMTDKNPDKPRIPSVIGKMLENSVEQAWICGPSGFNRYYCELLVSLGLQKEKIMIM